MGKKVVEAQINAKHSHTDPRNSEKDREQGRRILEEE
jgi:hypothetical protein